MRRVFNKKMVVSVFQETWIVAVAFTFFSFYYSVKDFTKLPELLFLNGSLYLIIIVGLLIKKSKSQKE